MVSKAEKSMASKLFILALVVILVMLLLRLGFWQLDRAEEKKLLIKQWQQPATETLLNLDKQPGFYRKVEFEGLINNRQYFLLDNRTRQGKVGYELIVLTKLADNTAILVNLGWLATGTDRSTLPTVELPNSKVKFSGWMKQQQKVFQLKEDQWQAGWPKRIQQIEIDKIASVTNIKNLATFVLLNEKPLLESLTTAWKPVNMSAQKHIGYAFQWFLMAFTLSVMLLWFGLKQSKKTGVKHYE